MKRATKITYRILAGLALSWLIFAQSCVRFITSDSEAKEEFAKDSVDIQLKSTIIEGRTIHYAMTGQPDKPTLFFVHGSPGSWAAFDKYLQDKDLLRYFRLISIDRPGFGYSDYGDAINITRQAALIGTLIGKLQNGRDFYVIGHSLGGPLAVKLAANYKTYISGIVLLAASVDPNEEKKEKWRPWMKAFPLRYLLPGAFRPSNIELWEFKKDVLTMPGDLNSITCPVIIIQGLKDPLVPPGNAFYAQKALVNARSVKLITIDSANHFIPWTRFPIIKNALLSLPH
jgi:pimeloyl-ACP methyl ester carboxylesterase